MTDVSMTIGGERVDAPSTFGVVNPATGEVHAEAPDCSQEQLDEAFDAAAKAFVDWRRDEDARRDALKAASDALVRRRRPDRPDPHRGAGQAAGRGADGGDGRRATGCSYFADLEMPREVIQDDDAAYAEVVRRPMGVVAAITPWNFPIVLASWKIAPGAAGRQHDGPEAVAVHAPQHAADGRDPQRGAPAGRAQRRVRWRRARASG